MKKIKGSILTILFSVLTLVMGVGVAVGGGFLNPSSLNSSTSVSQEDETVKSVAEPELTISNVSDFEIRDGVLNGLKTSVLNSIGDRTYGIVIPNTVTSIKEAAYPLYGAFYNKREQLVSVSFQEGSQLTNIGAYAFSGSRLEDIGIPDRVTGIGKGAFSQCSSLKTVKIAGTVTSIEESAFNACSNLETVVFGEGSQLTSIGRFAFYKSGLESVELPESVQNIGDSAFYYCPNLKSINIPDAVTCIEYHTFQGCTNLKNVTFGEKSKLTTIEGYAFWDCSNLVIEIPDSVTSIGEGAFSTSLKLIVAGSRERAELFKTDSSFNLTDLSSKITYTVDIEFVGPNGEVIRTDKRLVGYNFRSWYKSGGVWVQDGGYAFPEGNWLNPSGNIVYASSFYVYEGMNGFVDGKYRFTWTGGEDISKVDVIMNEGYISGYDDYYEWRADGNYFTLSYQGETLQYGVDYEYRYSDFDRLGYASAQIVGIGENWAGRLDVGFQVARTLNSEEFELHGLVNGGVAAGGVSVLTLYDKVRGVEESINSQSTGFGQLVYTTFANNGQMEIYIQGVSWDFGYYTYVGSVSFYVDVVSTNIAGLALMYTDLDALDSDGIGLSVLFDGDSVSSTYIPADLAAMAYALLHGATMIDENMTPVGDLFEAMTGGYVNVYFFKDGMVVPYASLGDLANKEVFRPGELKIMVVGDGLNYFGSFTVTMNIQPFDLSEFEFEYGWTYTNFADETVTKTGSDIEIDLADVKSFTPTDWYKNGIEFHNPTAIKFRGKTYAYGSAEYNSAKLYLGYFMDYGEVEIVLTVNGEEVSVCVVDDLTWSPYSDFYKAMTTLQQAGTLSLVVRPVAGNKNVVGSFEFTLTNKGIQLGSAQIPLLGGNEFDMDFNEYAEALNALTNGDYQITDILEIKDVNGNSILLQMLMWPEQSGLEAYAIEYFYNGILMSDLLKSSFGVEAITLEYAFMMPVLFGSGEHEIRFVGKAIFTGSASLVFNITPGTFDGASVYMFDASGNSYGPGATVNVPAFAGMEGGFSDSPIYYYDAFNNGVSFMDIKLFNGTKEVTSLFVGDIFSDAYSDGWGSYEVTWYFNGVKFNRKPALADVFTTIGEWKVVFHSATALFGFGQAHVGEASITFNVVPSTWDEFMCNWDGGAPWGYFDPNFEMFEYDGTEHSPNTLPYFVDGCPYGYLDFFDGYSLTILRNFGINVSYVYEDMIDAGTGQIHVVFSGNVVDEIVAEFEIAQRSIVHIAYERVEEGGDSHGFIVTDYVNARHVILVEDRDYYYVDDFTIEGIGNYWDQMMLDENYAEIGDFNIEILERGFVYTKSEIKPAISVTDVSTGTVLNASEYSVWYYDNINVGTATIMVARKSGVFTRTKEIHFEILPKDISEAGFTVTVGATAEWKKTGALPNVVVKWNGTLLYANRDYVLSADSTDLGMRTLTIEGIGNYEGTISSHSFTIIRTLKASDFEVTFGEVLWNGPESANPTVTVRDVARKVTLTGDVDYSVTFPDEKTLEIAVTITGNQSKYYYGSFTTYYTYLTGILDSFEYKLTLLENDEILLNLKQNGNTIVLPYSIFILAFDDETYRVEESLSFKDSYGNDVALSGLQFMLLWESGSLSGFMGDFFERGGVPIFGGMLTIMMDIYNGSGQFITDFDILILQENYGGLLSIKIVIDLMTIEKVELDVTYLDFDKAVEDMLAGKEIGDDDIGNYFVHQLSSDVTVPFIPLMLASMDVGEAFNYSLVLTDSYGLALVFDSLEEGVGVNIKCAKNGYVINHLFDSWDDIYSILTPGLTELYFSFDLERLDAMLMLLQFDDSTKLSINVLPSKIETFMVLMSQLLGTDTGLLIDGNVVYDGTEHMADVLVWQQEDYSYQEFTLEQFDYILANLYGTYGELKYVGDLVNVGTVEAQVVFSGWFYGTVSETYEITARDIRLASAADVDEQKFSGTAVTPKVVVTDFLNNQTVTLVEHVDYDLSYSSNDKPGTGIITITGKGNYCESFTVEFNIVADGLTGVTVTPIGDQTYTGEEIKPNPVITDNYTGATLKFGVDYDLQYSGNLINVGTVTVKIIGKGKYEGGTLEITFKIVQKSLEERGALPAIGGVDLDSEQMLQLQWTGSALEPDVEVYYFDYSFGWNGGSLEGGQDPKRFLAKGTDYIVNYSSNIEVGRATVTIMGVGNYKGMIVGYFDIVARELSESTMTVTVSPAGNQTFIGKEIKPAVTLTDKGLKKSLVLDWDFEVSYSSNLNVGTAYILISAGVSGHYQGSMSISFNIVARDITGGSLELNETEFVWTGKSANVNVESVTVDGIKLTAKDFDFVIQNSRGQVVGSAVAIGTYTVVVAAKEGGNFTGKLTKNFAIVEADISLAEISPLEDVSYDGQAHKPSLTLTYEGQTLDEGTHFEVEYPQDCTSAGTIIISIRGLGNFAGETTVEFEILPREFEGNVTVDQISDQTYTGQQVMPEPKVWDGQALLVKDVDYKLSYKSNVDVGVATVTITGKGNYDGTLTAQFNITQLQMSKFEIVYTYEDASGNEHKLTGNDVEIPYVYLLKRAAEGNLEFVLTDEKGGEHTIVYGQKYDNWNIIYLQNGRAVDDLMDTSLFGNKIQIVIEAVDNDNGLKNFGSISAYVTIEKITIDRVEVEVTYYDFEQHEVVTTTMQNGTIKWSPKVKFAGKVFDAYGFNLTDLSGDFTSLVKTYSGSGTKSYDVGDHTFTATAKNENVVEGTASTTITVEAITVAQLYESQGSVKDAAKVEMQFEVTSKHKYNGKEQKPSIFVSVLEGEKVISKRSDYTVWLFAIGVLALNGSVSSDLSYVNNIGAGEASAIVTFSGDVVDSFTIIFTIEPRDISSVRVEDIEDQDFTGKEITPDVIVSDTLNGELVPLEFDVDYNLSYDNNTDVGTATITIIGKGNYTGTKEVTFTILGKSLQSEGVTASTVKSVEWDGTAQRPDVVVMDGDVVVDAENYTLEYQSNTAVGLASIVITGRKNYSGTKTITFEITKRDIAEYYQVSGVENKPYTGSPVEQENLAVRDRVRNELLTVNVDYTVRYERNTDAGVASIIITGAGNYEGEFTINFTIGKVSLADAELTLSESSFEYDGESHLPTVTVRLNDVELQVGVDFEVTYQNAQRAGIEEAVALGDYWVLVTGKGNFSESTDIMFKIVRADISKARVTLDFTSTTFNQAVQKATPTVELAGNTLVLGRDFTVTYRLGSANGTIEENPKNAGTYYVIITGTGNYQNTYTTANFVINPASLDDADVKLVDIDRVWKNADIIDEVESVTITPDADTVLNVALSDINVIYLRDGATCTDFQSVGEIVVRITAKSANYDGQVEVSYAIDPRSIQLAEIGAFVDKTYNRKAQKQDVVLTDNGVKYTLVENKDFIVSYSANVNVGTVTVTITGQKNYMGTITNLTFEINPATVTGVTLSSNGATYDERDHKPVVRTVLAGGIELETREFKVLFKRGESDVLAEEIDFRSAGKITVVIQIADGVKNFVINSDLVATYTATFEISPSRITDVFLKDSSVVYDTQEHRDLIESVTSGTLTLEEGEDYTVAYTHSNGKAGDFTNQGTITIVVTARGNFTGAITKKFVIEKRDITELNVKYYYRETGNPDTDEPLDDNINQIYIGHEVYPVFSYQIVVNGEPITVTLSFTDDGNSANDDYTLTVRRIDGTFDNFENVGQYIIEATGVNNYTGSRAQTYNVIAEQFSDERIEVKFSEDNNGEFTFTNDRIRPNPEGDNPDFTVWFTDAQSGEKYQLTFNAVERGFTLYTGEVKLNKDGKIATDHDEVVYTISDEENEDGYYANINVGTAMMFLQGTGDNFTGVICVHFSIVPPLDVEVKIEGSYTYTGKQIKPTVVVTWTYDPSYKMKEGTDYLLEYGENISAGQGTVTITGINNFEGFEKEQDNVFNFEIQKKNIGATDVLEQISNTTYNTKEQKQPFTLTYGGQVVDSSEYTFIYRRRSGGNGIEDITSAGTIRITITAAANGNFTGTRFIDYEINKAQIGSVQLDKSLVIFNFEKQEPTITVYDINGVEVASGEYTISYSSSFDFISVGSVTITIGAAANGNYVVNRSASVSVTFTIDQLDINAAGMKVAAIQDETYTGKQITPSVVMTFNETHSLILNTHYTRTFGANMNVGEGQIYVVGTGNLKGNRTVTFSIVAKSLADGDIEVEKIADVYYNGEEQKKTPVVKFNGMILNSSDIKITYSTQDFTNASENAIIVTITAVEGGNYADSTTTTYKILARSLETCTKVTLNLNDNDFTYTGKAIKPVIVSIEVRFVDGQEYMLTLGDDEYTFEYGDNLNVADGGRITIHGAKNFTGSYQYDFDITPRELSSSAIAFTFEENYTYTGKSVELEFSFVLGTVTPNYTLVLNQDFVMNFVGIESAPINNGSYSVQFSAKAGGNFSGSVTRQFKINRLAITANDIKFESDEVKFENVTVVYTGLDQFEGIKNKIIVKIDGFDALVMGRDFNVAKMTTNTTDRGEKTIRIEGLGNFAGSIDVTFTINPRTLDKGMLHVVEEEYHYNNGQEIRPQFTVVYDNGVSQLFLEDGRDFIASYKNNTQTSTVGNLAVLTIAAKDGGNYVGEIVFEYTILKTKPVVHVVVEDRIVYVGENAKDINIWTTLGDTPGTVEFDSYVIEERENNVYLLTWTFTPEDGENFETITGTYEITAYVKVVVEFGDVSNLIEQIDTNFTVTVNKVVGAQISAFEQYTLKITNLDTNEEVASANSRGNYKVEVLLDESIRNRYHIDGDNFVTFYIRTTTLSLDEGILAYLETGFEEGIELRMETIGDAARIKEILGKAYGSVKKIHHLTRVYFVKVTDGVEEEVTVDGALIYLVRSQGIYNVYTFDGDSLKKVTGSGDRTLVTNIIVYAEKEVDSFMIWIIIVAVILFILIVIAIIINEYRRRKKAKRLANKTNK